MVIIKRIGKVSNFSASRGDKIIEFIGGIAKVDAATAKLFEGDDWYEIKSGIRKRKKVKS